MKEKKTKDYSLPFLIVVGLCVILVGATIFYVIELNKGIHEVESISTNKKINVIDNFDTISGVITKSYSMSDGLEMDEGYDIHYFFGGSHKGMLMIGEMHEELIEITSEKLIKDIYCVTDYNTEFNVEDESDEKEPIYISTLYVLFEDGTIGKIDTKDIKRKEYFVKQLEKFSNINYFIEIFEGGETINSGGAYSLFGIDINGKANYIDSSSSQ